MERRILVVDVGAAQEVGVGELGGFLRGHRLAARLSLSELARRAEVAKSTLSRWEAGRAEPDVVPLRQVLRALGVDAAGTVQALALLRAPRGARALRELDRREGRDLGEIGVSAPVFGSALRALRGRSGLTADDLAGRVGVARSTLGLWETGQRMPGSRDLALVAELCGAGPEERAALLERRLPVPLGPEGPDRLVAWLERLVDRLARERRVNEVEAAGFEAEAWRLAQHDDRGAALLGQYYNVRAGAHCETFAVAEVRRSATKARDLPFYDAPRLVSHVPESCLAWVQYGTVGLGGMDRTLRRLERCFERPMTGYERWSLHLFLARFYAEQGRVDRLEGSLAQADREAGDDAHQAELTMTYSADCWEAAGYPERALRLLPEELPDVWAVPAHLETVRLSALVQLGERDAAARSQQRLHGWIAESGIVTVEARRALGLYRGRFGEA